MKNKRTPEIRFAGFTDAWEQRELGKIAEMFDNLRIPITASERVKGDTPYYGANGVQDYVEGFTHDGEFVLIAEDGANDLINYPVNYVNGKVWVNNHAHVVSGKKGMLDNLFLVTRIKSMNISTYLVGGGRAKLNGETLKKISVAIPGFEEQKKIGGFLEQLDNLITLHQRELTTLKQTKQGFLQKMFPREGESVPEVRFPGFTGDWEQRKLSDVADYYDGTHQTPKYTDEGVKFISVENIKNIWKSDKYISENDYEKQFKIKPQINDIFMTRITAGVIGDTALVEQDDPLAYYVSLALIRPKSIVPLYLEKYINSPFFKNELHMRIIHTAFPKKINLGDIGECGIKIPYSKKEQVQIGEFFKQFDNLITLHQRELDTLKETKRAFLQKMFV